MSLPNLLNRLTFRQLQVFQAVYRLRSYSRAAEQLGPTIGATFKLSQDHCLVTMPPACRCSRSKDPTMFHGVPLPARYVTLAIISTMKYWVYHISIGRP